MAININISNACKKPIYEQIEEQIKALILEGTLNQGDPLPSVRGLAKDLRISIITTKRAYDELEQKGFILTYPGKGSYVKGVNSDFIREEGLKEIEEHLTYAVDKAKLIGITKAELIQLITVLEEGE